MDCMSNFSSYIYGLSVNHLFNNSDEGSNVMENVALVMLAGAALVSVAAHMYFRNQLARAVEGRARGEEGLESVEQLGEHINAIRRGRWEREEHPFGRTRGNDRDFRLSRN